MLQDDSPEAPDTGAGPGASVRMGQLASRLGFHLRLAQVAVWRDFSASMSKLDLTQRQVAVLELVLENPGVAQVDLAAALGTDRATMMAIVDRLSASGLVERRRSVQDRRRQKLYVTADGDAAAKVARGIIAEHEARFCSRFTSRELQRLTEALKRIHQR